MRAYGTYITNSSQYTGTHPRPYSFINLCTPRTNFCQFQVHGRACVFPELSTIVFFFFLFFLHILFAQLDLSGGRVTSTNIFAL